MPASLLIEIGVEELPASFVARALETFPGIVTGALRAARIAHGQARPYGTPRRIAVLVRDVAERQSDLEEQVLGPPKAVAFEADGKTPGKAAEGFARKLGVPVSAVRIVTTDKGEYAAIDRREPGRPIAEVLPATIARAIAEIPFPKSMRWGEGEVAFGRPIHWLVVLHGAQPIPTRFAGIVSGSRTRGHRFLAPREVEIPTADAYRDVLRGVHVLADEAERRATMLERLQAAARRLGGEIVPDDSLVAENASLVEDPHVIAGSFDTCYLSLPEEVIVAVMRGHQRYFAVRSGGGGLMPRYLAVVNTAKAPEKIAKGNDRVLRARLADARFFVETDARTTLAERVPKLDGIVFQAKLGTVGEKARRVGLLAAKLSGDPRAEWVAPLAKADLVSLIVGEFPELQGVMGRHYALREGLPGEVADAIRDHLRPRTAADGVPASPLAAWLAVADRADTLVGCFGIGLVPTGGADPFALRRAALGVARIALDGPIDVALDALLGSAWDLYAAQEKKLAPREEVLARLDEFFRARLRAYLTEQLGHPVDVVDACMAAWRLGSMRDLAARVRGLTELRALPAYESLVVAFRRAYNIARDAPAGQPEPALFEHEAERALYARFAEVRDRIEKATAAGDYASALELVAAELREPVDRFFDSVFVMVDDARVRANRLALLRAIAETMTRIAHVHLLGS